MVPVRAAVVLEFLGVFTVTCYCYCDSDIGRRNVTSVLWDLHRSCWLVLWRRSGAVDGTALSNGSVQQRHSGRVLPVSTRLLRQRDRFDNVQLLRRVQRECWVRVQSPCPAGQYSTNGSVGSCSPCPSGTYGSATGLSTSTCSGLCTGTATTGYYCGPGMTTATGALCKLKRS